MMRVDASENNSSVRILSKQYQRKRSSKHKKIGFKAFAEKSKTVTQKNLRYSSEKILASFLRNSRN